MLDKIQEAQASLARDGAAHLADLIAWDAPPDGVDYLRADAQAVFAKHGHADALPELPIDSAVTASAREGRKPKGLTVEAFARPLSDTPLSLGIYRSLARIAGESGDDRACVARVRVQLDRAVALPPEGASTIDDRDASEWSAAIAARANHHVTHVSYADVSAALYKVIARMGGVPHKRRGGSYFLPSSACARWRALAADFERTVGLRFAPVELYDAPTGTNAQTVASSANASLERDLAELREELADSIGKGAAPDARKRPAALAERVKRCETLRAKAALYRGLLAGQVDQLDDAVRKLESGFGRLLDGEKLDAFEWCGAAPAAEPAPSKPAAEVPGGSDPFSLGEAAE